jgi:hypothetical protein
LYAALTIALTWPLARGLARDVPGDFGDPLFTSWVLAWDAMHLGPGWWNANVFAPHPLALAYSEHFLPQGLQALPIYLATRNPILAYNIVFLTTFVLSGLGMFLFARELTRNSAAAVVAGLAYAFSPYRIASIPHLQVLSSAWMPFVLFGLRRHFDTRRAAPLAWAAGAWALQNLSCGYYLLFFSPIVACYILWELSVRGLWRDPRELARIGAACAVVAAITTPFLLPYLELRRLGFSPRSIGEARRFSADVYAYFTADPSLRLSGAIWKAWPRAEGLLFPGMTIVVLAALAAVSPSARSSTRNTGRLLFALGAFSCLAATLLLGYSIRLPFVKMTSFSRLMAMAAALAAIALAVSRANRAALGAWLRTPVAWLLLTTAFAIAMSFGPDVRAMGRTVASTNVYALFYEYVPGFDGLRVPARYAMIAVLGLAALASFGAAALEARFGKGASIVAGVLIVAEAIAVPIPLNQYSNEYGDSALAPLPRSIGVGPALPAVYTFVAGLPASAVLLELPLGEPAFDVRYMFYSTTHWRRLVNGYSGGEPAAYRLLVESLKDVDSRPDRAWQRTVDSSATHVVVHEAFYKGDRGARLGAWLRANGAREIAALGTDRVFAMP